MRLAIRTPLGGNILCIDWDERMLRVVDALMSRGGTKVRAAVHVPIPEDVDIHDAEAFGQFIKRSLAEHRIRTRRAVVNVPRQDAVLNLLSLPYGSADEMASMVHIQTAKELPFSKDEAVLDFAIARLKDSNLCEVWVSAVRNQVIDYYRRVIAAAGLRLERIGLRPYANLLAMTTESEIAGRTLVVDVGPSMTEISVIREGRLAYSRAASVSVPAAGLGGSRGESGEGDDEGGPDESGEQVLSMQAFEQRRSALDALLVEVGRTVEAYRATDPGASIDRIVLAGLAGLDHSVTLAFERRFRAATAPYRPTERSTWKAADESSQALFSACVGLALGNEKEGVDHFDFLHPTEPEAERRERAKRVPWIAAAAVILAILAGYGAYWPISQAHAAEEELKNEIKQYEGDKKQRKNFNEEYEKLADWVDTSVPVVDQLLWLSSVFPSNEEAYITKVIYDDKGQIDLELAVKDKTVATELARRINELEQDGEKLFIATAGKPTDRRDDPHYKFKDELQIRILSVAK